MLLNALRDLQGDGLLVHRNQESAASLAEADELITVARAAERLRIPVSTVVGMVADGMTADEILEAFPDLEREDIPEALHYVVD